jgi:hypothetical protein
MIYNNKQYSSNHDNFVALWIMLILLALLYPILISIYVVLPSFIGLAGYWMISGIRDDNLMPIFISSLYLINLDINTSVPIFSGIISVLLCYLFILPRFRIIANCKICTGIIIVISIYIIYFVVAYIFDFAFELDIVHVSLLILISIIIDILLVSML